MRRPDLTKAMKVARDLQHQERAVSQEPIPSQVAMQPLDEILPRVHADLRPVYPQHVQELYHSISIRGLIHPMVIDRRGHILAGAHRRLACRLLREQLPAVFHLHFPGGLIPVRVFDFDATEDRERARQIEFTENDQHRPMSKPEVLRALELFQASGVTLVLEPEALELSVPEGTREVRFGVGRPAAGQTALIPLLAQETGRCTRTVARWLAQHRQAEAPPVPPPNPAEAQTPAEAPDAALPSEPPERPASWEGIALGGALELQLDAGMVVFLFPVERIPGRPAFRRFIVTGEGGQLKALGAYHLNTRRCSFAKGRHEVDGPALAQACARALFSR